MSKKKIDRLAVGLALFLTFFRAYWIKGIPHKYDLYLGLPIAKHKAFPELYSPKDLLISASQNGPFHFYRVLSWFYSQEIEPGLWLHLGLLAIVFVCFYLIWQISEAVIPSKAIAFLVTFLIGIGSETCLTLNSSFFPPSALVSRTAALPFALYTFLLILRRQEYRALFFAALAFNIHPGYGFISGIAAAAVLILNFKREDIAKVTRWGIPSVLIFLPNFTWILAKLQGDSSTPAVSSEDFFALFKVFSWHAYSDAHLAEYGIYFLHLLPALAFFALNTKAFSRRPRQVISVLFALTALYVLNLYLFESLTVVLMFLFRTTVFLKPLIYIAVVAGILFWYARYKSNDVCKLLSAHLSILFLSLSVGLHNPLLGQIFALIGYFGIICLTKPRTNVAYFTLFVLLAVVVIDWCVLRQIWYLPTTNAQRIVNALSICVSPLIAISLWSSFRDFEISGVSKFAPYNVSPVLAATLVFVLLISRSSTPYYGLLNSLQSIRDRSDFNKVGSRDSGILEWARYSTPPGSMFVMHPNRHLVVIFRLLAERSVYISYPGLLQLAYHPPSYILGGERLVKIGSKVIGERYGNKMDHVDFDGYYSITDETLSYLGKSEGVDYAIFENSERNAEESTFPIVYEDEYFSVVQIRREDL